jgi:hypothetical protein
MGGLVVAFLKAGLAVAALQWAAAAALLAVC